MELNREASGLDQEQAAGRFTLTRYILYLLPVIGFIGTVEGISKALMNISQVLPMVKDLDGFLNNLTSVTSALQIAFDSTLLALFLSAALMLVQTLVTRRAEDLLARVDRWVVEHALPRFAGPRRPAPTARPWRPSAATWPRSPSGRPWPWRPWPPGWATAWARTSTGSPRRSTACRRRSPRSATGPRPSPGPATRWAAWATSTRRSAGAWPRWAGSRPRWPPEEANEQLDQIRRAVDRSCAAIEALAAQWASAFEKSSRATQEQLARTLHSLKDALDLLHVSMEQGNTLYRNIVKKMAPSYPTIGPADDRAA